MKQLIYKGTIIESDSGENCDALFIGGGMPIAEILQHEINGKEVSVRYWISDKEKTKEELQENFLKNLFGAVDAEYRDAYSDYTGYLWTNENLEIGGHDLLGELRGNLGKFIWLEIDVY
nr:hypothetical protein [uncultured Flavobacterium sp.]